MRALAPLLVSGLAAAAIALAPRPSLAKKTESCIFFPTPRCEIAPHIGFSYGWGRSRADGAWFAASMASAEIGVLVRASTAPTIQWGPVLDVGFDNAPGVTSYGGGPKIMGRLWINELFNTDFTLGPRFEHLDLKGGFWAHNRLGGAAEMTFMASGLFGGFVSGAVLAGVGQEHGAELRILGGIRGNLVGLAPMVAILIPVLYATR
jgi:hypothetical protein